MPLYPIFSIKLVKYAIIIVSSYLVLAVIDNYYYLHFWELTSIVLLFILQALIFKTMSPFLGAIQNEPN